jgi:succinate dehydrogenase / fumarate reductase, flavoprotein subunit
VHRLAQVSVDIIDQMVAQGVPFAREYGGMLDNRSFGGAQVSRTFYARGQTGQQLLLGAYQQMARQVGLGNVKLWNRMELVDVVVVDGRCAGIVTRDLMTGEVSSHSATPWCSPPAATATRSSCRPTRWQCNVTGAWRAHRKGALFANPCYTQIHPTCIPQADDFQSKLTLMSESLRNDGRVWVPTNVDETRSPDQIPESERDYYLERLYPSFGNLAPRDISSRAAKRMVDSGPRCRPVEERCVPRLLRRHRTARQGRRRGALREPVRDVRAHHRREPLRRADAHLPGSRTTRWVGSGSTTSCMTTIPGLYALARPTSPTTAPTASVRRR